MKNNLAKQEEQTEKPTFVQLEKLIGRGHLRGKFVETEGIARGVEEYSRVNVAQYTAFLQAPNKKNYFLFLVGGLDPDVAGRFHLAKDPNYPDGETFRKALEGLINMDRDEIAPLEVAKYMQAMSMLRASSETGIPVRVSGVLEGKLLFLHVGSVGFQDYGVKFSYG